MNNTQILKIWEEMKAAASLGIVKRALPNSSFRLYCIYTYPENTFGIAISFSENIKVDISPFDKFKELDVRLLKDKSFVKSLMLIVQINSDENKEIFSVLSSDLIKALNGCDSEKNAIRITLNQLSRWKSMFDVGRSRFLSPSAQQGLYGELYFMRKLLKHNMDIQSVLNSWVGPFNEIRDFEGTDWTLEVKTSITSMPQTLKINGERQLDETLIENLFLYHLSLQKTKANGETLPEIVNQIYEYIDSDVMARQLFDTRLFEVGYYSSDIDEYINVHYIIRNENSYKVEGDFPRIKEEDLRNGVGSVRYEISISSCDNYLIPEQQLFNCILL